MPHCSLTATCPLFLKVGEICRASAHRPSVKMGAGTHSYRQLPRVGDGTGLGEAESSATCS